MAYVSAPTRTTGIVITQSIWNRDAVSNPKDLYAGALAMTSQAANDAIVASSSTQWVRRAAATGFLKFNDAGSAWELLDITSWPVGSIFIGITATNPNTLLGGGTWTAFGTGRLPVGLDAGNPSFDTVEETGGAKTVALSTAEMPAHTHVQDSHNHTQDSHNHTQDAHGHVAVSSHFHNTPTSDVLGTSQRFVRSDGTTNSGQNDSSPFAPGTSISAIDNQTATNQAQTATNQAQTATNQNAGSGTAHNNLMPYIVVYMWKRTA